MKPLETVRWTSTNRAGFGAANEIQVWRLPILPDSGLQLESLSKAEQAQAASLTLDSARTVYISSRIAMRRLFAELLACAPTDIGINRSPEGKPFVAAPKTDIEFNLTHSGEMILLAISNCGPVGIDVEPKRELRNKLAIANRVFSTEMLKQLHAAGDSDLAFVQLWTEFEARQKIHGQGVFGEKDDGDIELHQFAPAEQYVASLACQRLPGQASLVFYQFQDY
ncbi:MAG: 4'-phosphopantetheinyl transferase superfamily protein [Chromatiales bacterium]|jgi:4'-phosphopantetheinyl transferase